MKGPVIPKEYSISALILKVLHVLEDTSYLKDLVTRWKGYIIFNNIFIAQVKWAMYNEQGTMASLLKDRRSLYQGIMLNYAGTVAFSGVAQSS